MAERILKFGGIDPLSMNATPAGAAEPEEDPRARQGTEVVANMHLMSAVEQLEPVGATSMAYVDPSVDVSSVDELKEELEDRDLEEIITFTPRFSPLINPRRSRQKGADRTQGSDFDLWHVPTSSYNARSPRSMFEPLARAIDNNDAVSNEGVYGEFRERRNGGEVHGEVWFDDFDVGAIDDDPVRLGFRVRWNYYGDLAFGIQPFAQQTRCKNSVRSLDRWEAIMAHNKDPNLREVWEEKLNDLGLYGDALSQQIMDARDLVFAFNSDEDEADGDLIPMPISMEEFYEHLDLPEPELMAEQAASEAGGETEVSAWHLHAGVTYFLSWHWNGSESSRAFRQYRRTADDLLMNPHQMADRVAQSVSESAHDEAVRQVAEEHGVDPSDFTDEHRAQVDSLLADNEAVVRVDEAAESVAEMKQRFEETEQRLNAIQEQLA